jgi:hypothetical protein
LRRALAQLPACLWTKCHSFVTLVWRRDMSGRGTFWVGTSCVGTAVGENLRVEMLLPLLVAVTG